LNTQDVNIITVEDPVEYQLQGINQVQTHAEVGLTFAAALRSILRQDPDIVLVGEVRDFETASIAVQAALTGHLVLSTLHTNDAPGAVSRLKNMGIEPFMLASALILAQAQRLYRRLCPECKKEVEITLEDLKHNHIRTEGMEFTSQTVYMADSCPKCAQLGYKGRGGIMEIMEVNDVIREMILKEANSKELMDAAIGQGMITLQRAGVNKVFEGLTSLDEVLRITSSV
jgi:type IV pilus assembly protein PilB